MSIVTRQWSIPNVAVGSLFLEAQRLFPAVAGDLSVREDGAGYVAERFGIRQAGAEVGEPEFLHAAGIGGEAGGFAEEHVAVFPGLGQHVVLAVHAFADEEVGIGGGGGDGGHGAGIGAVGEFEPTAGGTQHHIRRIDFSFVFDGFAFFLEPTPEFHGYAELAGADGIELALAGEGEAVAIAGDAVLHLEGVDIAIEEVHGLLRSFELAHADFKGEVGGYGAQGVDDAFGADGADNG